MDHRDRYDTALAALADHHGVEVSSRFLSVDVPPVERVHCLVAGEGPPLVLLHGVGVGATSWLPLVADLAADYTCYALDRPGRGLSDPLDHTTVDFRAHNAAVLAACVDELGVETCPVVGNSFGGFQALLLALDRPERVSALALLGAPAGLSGDYPLDHTTVDFRTHNAAALAACVDELGVETCPVVGNSFGGFQALLLALDRPERVSALALLGAPAGLSGDYPLRMRLGSVRWLGPKLVALAEPDDVAGARELFGRVAVVDEASLSEPFLEAYLAELEPPGRAASLASVFRDSLRLRGARPSFVIREELSAIEQPTLFVWGSEDQFFPPSVGRPVAERMGNARFVELDGVGHAPWLDAGERCAAELRSFLATH